MLLVCARAALLRITARNSTQKSLSKDKHRVPTCGKFSSAGRRVEMRGEKFHSHQSTAWKLPQDGNPHFSALFIIKFVLFCSASKYKSRGELHQSKNRRRNHRANFSSALNFVSHSFGAISLAASLVTLCQKSNWISQRQSRIEWDFVETIRAMLLGSMPSGSSCESGGLRWNVRVLTLSFSMELVWLS